MLLLLHKVYLVWLTTPFSFGWRDYIVTHANYLLLLFVQFTDDYESREKYDVDNM